MQKNILALALLTAVSVNTLAEDYSAGDILVRGGATLVEPDSDKSKVKLDDVDSGLTVSVDNNTQLGLNFVYFYDQNWAVELLAATPFSHDVEIHTPAGSATLANVKHLPPTLSALYYFNTASAFKPYVGLGINYTVFFDEEFESDFSDASFKKLSLDDSFGLAAQVGADLLLNDKWHLNASVRYIDIQTDVSFKVADVVDGSVSVDINPFVYSVMVGYKF